VEIVANAHIDIGAGVEQKRAPAATSTGPDGK
jgi:hypothetical protein